MNDGTADTDTTATLGMDHPSTKEGRISGPLFRVRCTRCKVDHTSPCTEALSWVASHHQLHIDMARQGKPF